MGGATIIPLFGGCASFVEWQILGIVRRLERRSGRVYAWMVEPWLEPARSERTIRRAMLRMAAVGVLARHGERSGYTVSVGGRRVA